MEAAATAQPRWKLTPFSWTAQLWRISAFSVWRPATAQPRHARQLTAMTEVQRVEAAATAQRRHVRQLTAPMEIGVWRLLQLPSPDTSVS